jgi:hypothetical protein
MRHAGRGRAARGAQVLRGADRDARRRDRLGRGRGARLLQRAAAAGPPARPSRRQRGAAEARGQSGGPVQARPLARSCAAAGAPRALRQNGKGRSVALGVHRPASRPRPGAPCRAIFRNFVASDFQRSSVQSLRLAQGGCGAAPRVERCVCSALAASCSAHSGDRVAGRPARRAAPCRHCRLAARSRRQPLLARTQHTASRRFCRGGVATVSLARL